MEPMNCTAEARGDRCVLWAPTQGQTMCVTEVSDALGIPPENIEVNRTFLGGGSGRRLIADYAVQAALASRAVQGRPVKLIWIREQDIRHDHFRPEELAPESTRNPNSFPSARKGNQHMKSPSTAPAKK